MQNDAVIMFTASLLNDNINVQYYNDSVANYRQLATGFGRTTPAV